MFFANQILKNYLESLIPKLEEDAGIKIKLTIL